MRLTKIDRWVDEPINTDHPLLISSVEWTHTELVDHVNIALGSNVQVGCSSTEDIKIEVWLEQVETDVTRQTSVEGLGTRTFLEQETQIKVLGTTLSSTSSRPIRVKNLDDDKQYLLVSSDHFKIIEIEGVELTLEEQIKLYKVAHGLSKDLQGISLSNCKITFDLSGCGLRGSTFDHVDFLGDLRGANLSGVHLTYCDLKGLNLEGANFSNSILKSVDFSCSSLRGSTFLDADLDEPLFVTCSLEGVDFTKASFNGGDFTCALCEGVDFSGLDYSYEESLSDCLNGYLNDPRLLFSWADLRGAKFDGLSLNHAQFNGATLTGATFKDCDLSSSEDDYRDSRYEYYSGGTSFKGAQLGLKLRVALRAYL
jgi:uncharacterized protein YjbI with pentapeptide repeats